MPKKTSERPQEGRGGAQGRGFIDALEDWLRVEPREPFTDTCASCGGGIVVTYEQGRMLPKYRHAEPVCESYRLLDELWGNPEAQGS